MSFLLLSLVGGGDWRLSICLHGGRLLLPLVPLLLSSSRPAHAPPPATQRLPRPPMSPAPDMSLPVSTQISILIENQKQAPACLIIRMSLLGEPGWLGQ